MSDRPINHLYDQNPSNDPQQDGMRLDNTAQNPRPERPTPASGEKYVRYYLYVDKDGRLTAQLTNEALTDCITKTLQAYGQLADAAVQAAQAVREPVTDETLYTKEYVDKAVQAESRRVLERFRVFCYEAHAFDAWDTPASNRQGWIDTKLREFDALLDSEQQTRIVNTNRGESGYLQTPDVNEQEELGGKP